MAALLDTTEDDPDVLAIAVAYKDGVYDMREIVVARFGSVDFEIADGWPHGTEVRKSRRVAPEHRQHEYRTR